MRIGIDARAAAEVPAGRGRLVRELLRELGRRDDDHHYLLYGREPWSEPLDARFSWRCRQAPDGPWHVWVGDDSRPRCDVFLATNSYLTVACNRVPTAVVIHDLMTFEPGMGAPAVSVVVERLLLGRTVRRAARLICNSRATADALISRFPAAAGRCTVARLGVASTLRAGPPAGADAASLPAPGFVLAVGTLEPRKNLPRLVEAYGELPRALQDAHPLVVVGAEGWQTGETLVALAALGDRCRRLGHVSDAVLAELYRRCGLFCYPSLGEGFGLPVLEAMAAGAPVVTSNVSSLPEVGGDAVIYVDPGSTASIAGGLMRVLSDPALGDRLRARGTERAATFRWSHFAERVLGELADMQASSG